MDAPTTVIDRIKKAKSKYESITDIQYALENWTTAGIVDKSHIKSQLINCEYSKNSQFIALTLVQGEGEPEKLLCNMDLNQITNAELNFLKETLGYILKMCDQITSMDIPEKLDFELAQLLMKFDIFSKIILL